MKPSQFSGTQKAFMLKQDDEGVSVAVICLKAGDQPGELFQLIEEARRHDVLSHPKPFRSRQAKSSRYQIRSFRQAATTQ